MTPQTLPPPIDAPRGQIGTESFHREQGFSFTELAAWSGLPVAKIHQLTLDAWLLTRKDPFRRPRISWQAAYQLLGDTCWWPHAPEESASRFSIRVKEAALLLKIPHSTLATKLNTHQPVPIKRFGRFALLRPVDLPLIRQWIRKTDSIPKQLPPDAQALHAVKAAKLLGVAHSLLYYWIKRGMIAARRSGLSSRIYVSQADILQLQQVFEEHRAKHSDQAPRQRESFSELVRAVFGLPEARRGRLKKSALV